MKKKLFVLLSIFVLVMPFMVYAEDPEPSADPTPTASPEPSQDPVEIKITVSPSSLELDEGDSKNLSVELEGTSSTVTWKSSDADVATVDNGTVTAKKAGTATITAEVEGKSANCAVTVKEKQNAIDYKIVITGGKLDKAFDKSITQYTVDVTDVNKFQIDVEPKTAKKSIPSYSDLSTVGSINVTIEGKVYNLKICV